jgi:ribonuclease HI
MCNQERETVDHVFMHCDWARRVWFTSPLTINLAMSAFQTFQEWFNYMLNHSSKECMQNIITITYSMWLARNKKAFQNYDTPVTMVVDRALNTLQDYQKHLSPNLLTSTSIRSPIASNNTRWNPPPRSSLKINVDAHLLDDGHCGLGLVLRRDDGLAVGAATRLVKGSGNVDLAETLGLNEAIQIIHDQHLRNVIIEMDAQRVVRAVNNKIFPRAQWGQLARHCARAIHNFDNVKLQWVSRQGNEAAHALARWAKQEPNRFWVENFPICIYPHIQNDMAPVT